MKIKELDVYNGINKTFEERKKDIMNNFIIALQMSLRFLKRFWAENQFENFIECEKQVASYCEKFRRSVGAIKGDEIQKIIKTEIENSFAVLEELPPID